MISFNGLIARGFMAACAAGLALSPISASAAWEPTKTVEFVVPAGTGGGADQMARMLQGVIQKHSLMKQSLVVINKSGGAGAEGFLEMKGAKDPHKIVITLSNVFTTPMATGVPFSWKDIKPVGMLALDQFVLWVNGSSPYQTTADFVTALKEGKTQFKMGGTGSKQEDQIITAAIEQATGGKFVYVPYKGGGDVAAQLVGNHVTSTVNNPIEAVSQWRAGQLRPLCVFDHQPMPYKEPVAEGKSWADIPTCKSGGLDVEYTMLRGIFTAKSANDEQVAYYNNLFEQVVATPEWKEFMERGAFNTTRLKGPEFEAWLTKAETTHSDLMTKAGFMAKK
jgi:putative tricarboxylic transport membrane protein